MNITFFRHSLSDSPVTLADVCDEDGHDYTIIDVYRQPLQGFDPLAPDILVVLGGAPGVYQADTYPFIRDEVEILSRRMAQDRPTLGICLGAQMMAAALGASVFPGPLGEEHGWDELVLLPGALDTPLRHFDPAFTKIYSWHGDTFEMPDTVIHLAKTGLYANQAFQYGQNSLALQFHPEVNRDSLADWFVSCAGGVASGEIDLVKLRSETDLYIDSLVRQTKTFFRDWLARVSADSRT